MASINLNTGRSDLYSGPDLQPTIAPGLEDQNPIMHYLGVLRARQRVVIITFLVIVGLVTAYSFLKTPIYRASGRLLIEPASLNVAPVQDVYDPTAAARDFQSRRDYLNTQVELIRSNNIMRQVFNHFNFGSMEEFEDSKEPLKDLAKLVNVDISRNTYLVDISFDWKDADFAAKVANYIAHLYAEDAKKRRGGFSGRGLETLRVELQQMQKAREQALDNLTEFKEKNNIINLDDAHKLLMDSISKLTEVLVDSEADVAIAQAKVEAIDQWLNKGGNLNTIPEIMENQTIGLFKLERMRAQSKLLETLMDYDPKHRKVRIQRDIIGQMTADINQEVKYTADSVRLTFERALMRYKIITQKLRDRNQEIIDLDKASGMYRILEDNLKATEDAFRMVLKRINEIKVLQSTGRDSSGGAIMVVSNATPPLKAAYPRKGLNIAIAAVAGLMLGIGLALLLDFVDSSVKDKDQVQSLLGGRPVLGFVPHLGDDEDETVAVQNPGSRIGESFQTLRTSLGLSVMGREQRCFAVTSAVPSEGKTLTSFNLAMSFSRDRKRVLLIEADMRKPRLHKLLGIDKNQAGLSNVLVGAANWSDVVVGYPEVERLDILTAGPIPPTPSELLGTQEFRDTLLAAMEAYDTVIVDTPPILNVADTSIIAGMGVPLILVVRPFKTDRKELAAAVSQINTVQGKIVGAVLNSVDVPVRGYYGYGQSYYYQAGYYSDAGRGKEKQKS